MRAGLVLLILPFAVCGCGDSEILPGHLSALTGAQTCELLSLDPRELDPKAGTPQPVFDEVLVANQIALPQAAE
jgi:hypothetical protein